MDDATTFILNRSQAKAKILIDANVINYAQNAYDATGIHLLDYLDKLNGTVDWFVSSCVAAELYNAGILPGLLRNILPCNNPRTKMQHFPFQKEDGSGGLLKLNRLAGDDWSQINLAYHYPDLIIVTNDSRMFKSAHAVLQGRAMAFHEFLNQLSPYWFYDRQWLKLKTWFADNVNPLRNNSSWILPEK